MFAEVIQSIQNVFLVLSLLFLVLYGLAVAVDKKPRWFMSKKLIQCRRLQQKYQKIVASRKDMIHHYYWAKSENQTKKMRQLKKDIDRMFEQILELKDSYDKIKKGIIVPLRIMA